MKIIDKVIDKRDAIISGGSGSTVAIETQTKAINAVLGGINSDAWEDFMELFVNNGNPAQLSRLKGTDATASNEPMRKRRAYIVGNFVCGFPTGTTTTREVPTIDEGLPIDDPNDAQGCVPTPPRIG